MLPALTLLAAVSGSLALSDRTEARVRDPGVDPNQASIDLETAPTARVLLTTPRTRYTLEYTPRLTFWDTNIVGIHPVILNNVGLHTDWHTRRVRLSLTETASYGQQNFNSLVTPTATTDAAAGTTGGTPAASGNPATTGPTTAAGVQPVPKAGTILFGNSTTILASGISFRRVAVDMAIGYQLSGGITHEATLTLPLQKGPFATASVDYALTRFDRIATTVAASEVAFSNGPESIVIEANEAWRRMWGRYTDTRLAVGAAAVHARTAEDAPYNTDGKPVLEGSIGQRFIAGHFDRGEARLDLRMRPGINRLSGIVDQTVGGSLSGRWQHEKLYFRLSGGASESVPTTTPSAFRTFLGEIGAGYQVTKALLVEVGGRASSQHSFQQSSQQAGQAGQAGAATTQPVPDLVTGVVFVAVTIQAPAMRF